MSGLRHTRFPVHVWCQIPNQLRLSPKVFISLTGRKRLSANKRQINVYYGPFGSRNFGKLKAIYIDLVFYNSYYRLNLNTYLSNGCKNRQHYSATNHSGSRRAEHFFLNKGAISLYFRPPKWRAFSGHTAIHRPQEMHFSGSVIRGLFKPIAPVGHSCEHFPHLLHLFLLVFGIKGIAAGVL